ncbi:MAG: multiheme c-type cytochrome [Thermodesulfobacteriota bacterium]
MRRDHLGYALGLLVLTLTLGACGREQPVDVKAITAQPKTYMGSETCKMCHLEHYDSWKMTLHSRMLQDAQKNRDAVVVELDEKKIRADLAKLSAKLKVPADKVYVPKIEEIKYTIGSQWKQRYLVEKNGELFISPIQYNLDTGRWVNYHEDTWDKNSWLLGCGGCHATGVDLAKKNFSEPAVACEACHGPGSHHVALPKTAVFDKRMTIVNPSKLTPGIAVQICGSCHNRGKATKHDQAEWPVGYLPGKALSAYYVSISYAGGAKGNMYPIELSKGHHQQYIDWVQSKHQDEGVTCASCHYVHQLGVPANRAQTKGSGSQQCLSCHTLINNNLAHSIHSFSNCIGCHMPRIVSSAESGDLHSHAFIVLLPKETLKNKDVPNSCQTCHRHKTEDLAELQKRFDALSQLPKPQGPVHAAKP